MPKEKELKVFQFVELEAHNELVQLLRGQIADLESQNKHLEKLRPHWAQGYTDDSMAAQGMTGAVTTLWELLGVDNQTMAVHKIKSLLDPNHGKPKRTSK